MLNATTGYCTFPLCSRIAEHKDMCFLHKIYSVKDLEKEKTAPVANQSVKRKEDQKEYRKIVKEMLTENPNCEIMETGCQGKATGLHHQKKRSPATLLDKRFLKRACDFCNIWCEIHPLEAIDKGHSISKFLKA